MGSFSLTDCRHRDYSYQELRDKGKNPNIWIFIGGFFVLCLMFGFVCFLNTFNLEHTWTNQRLKLSLIPNDTFPPGFLIGSATSAYQIEGAWNIDGKGEHIWDELVHAVPSLIKNNDTGDEACDSYHKYKEDMQLLKDIGFHHYRFSISWSRVLPTGYDGAINQAGLDYYHKLIDKLLENGIEPMLTLYHWDLPKPLQEIGGWANPLMADYFESYARIIFQQFASKVKWWITINEPKVITRGYGNTDNDRVTAPMIRQNGIADYLAAHTLLRAHAKAYRLYQREFKPIYGGKVSLSLDCQFEEPASDSEEDKKAANISLDFQVGLYAHPIYSSEGDYPKSVKEAVKRRSEEEGRFASRLPSFTADEIEQIRGSYDFFGLNHYTTHLVSPGQTTGILEDAGVRTSVDPAWPSAAPNWLKVVPWGFRKILNYIKTNYNNPPVFITENGFSSYNPVTTINDYDRIQFYHDYMEQMLKAIHEDECSVIGYTAWSLLDNFEWAAGYSQRFGLVFVDFEDPDKKRIPKLSAEFFKNVIKTNKLPSILNITDPYCINLKY